MEEKRDELFQQIIENNRESVVFFAVQYTNAQGIIFESGDDPTLVHSKTGTGFFVESDKVVTTIDILSGAVGVAAIPADQFIKIGKARPIHHYFARALINQCLRLFGKRSDPYIDKVVGYTLEGIIAFDAKNNLVLLKIAEVGKPLKLGNSDAVQIGEQVCTLGYWHNKEYKGSVGCLQSRYRNNNWLEVKANFFTGSNGGPVLNSSNEVIGVAALGIEFVAKDSRTPIATVISSNVIKKLLRNAGKAKTLDQWQNNSSIRAYILENQADRMRELNKNEEGITCYSAAIKLNPHLDDIYHKRGVLKMRVEDFKGALDDYNKTIQITPEHAIAYNNRATMKVNLGDIDGALDDLNRSIEIDPHYLRAYINRGMVKCQSAQAKTDEDEIAEAIRFYQDAIQDFDKALELYPKSRFVRKRRRNIKRILWLLNLRTDHDD